ncbi:MAG: DUF89 family protein [Deltaproteobacteria bacterium]|nr:DUF89 family protein [Deltaproteobacteria bacterium]
MKSYLECIPCFFHQALRASRIATDDEKLHKQVLDELGALVSEMSLEITPPETGRLVYRKVMEVTGNPDPFRELKRESTREAFARYSAVKAEIEGSDDKLFTAIRYAIAGNIIDFGPTGSFDIDATLEQVKHQDLAISDYPAFRDRLSAVSRVLYIGDNAGETVFDRLLIEVLGKEVTYVVRDSPIINDATAEDAVEAGLDEVATIVSSGSDAPGTILRLCSEDFRRRLDESEFTLAKGQGNYESLSGDSHEIFFLLKAKCSIIAADLGVAQGDVVLKGINL